MLLFFFVTNQAIDAKQKPARVMVPELVIIARTPPHTPSLHDRKLTNDMRS